ncbi:MAG: preprotein translocase subunit YajC [candidate division Zixibacteria bacterium]|nr:preprotein translocase subunit YajC [candidate division Zixibacteria bacterium]
MAPAGGEGGGMGSMMIFLVAIFAVMYFFMIRPQQKKQKEHKAMIEALKTGDKVVTNSGMMGTIVHIHDDKNKVVLKVADQVKVEFIKSSIAGLVEN